jgi:hypothetical protein
VSALAIGQQLKCLRGRAEPHLEPGIGSKSHHSFFRILLEEVWVTAHSRLGFLQENNVRIIVAAQNSETLSIRRQAE